MADEAKAVGEERTKGGKRLVIIDGYSLLYRAFFATRYLSTADGRPTNALFGFTSMLFTILESLEPDAIVVALDGGRTFRHDLDESYKGTRNETADELKVQLVEARNLIAALGIPQIEAPNFEADDVVGTVSKRAEENGYDTTVVTGDLDALQLVDDCVSVMTPRTGMSDTTTYDREAVIARYGFGPEHVPDFKAIKGDTSDNIKGVPGIGDKGGAELITAFGTVEEMWRRWDEIPPKFQKKMDGLQAQMMHSKLLATIVRDVPLEYDFRPFRLTAEQVSQAKAFMETFEFRQHSRNVERVLQPYVTDAAGATIGEAAPSRAFVADAYEFAESEVRSVPMLATKVRDHAWAVYMAPYIAGADLFDDGPRPAFVAVGKEVVKTTEPVALETLAQYGARAAVHDLKSLVRRAPEGVRPIAGFDATLAGYVLQSGRSSYTLRDLIEGYTDMAPPSRPEELAAGLLALRAPMTERLEKEGQTRVFEEVELPVAPILADMERAGIAVEADRLAEFSKELDVTIERTQAMIFEMAGEEFQIGSTKQLGRVLFETMGLPVNAKTATGAYATGTEVLSPLAAEHPIAGEILSWRELTKLKNTYADALGKLIAPDGRIHTTYNQTIAATGRLSSADPNLQNIPMRTELGRSIRKAFVASPGYELVSLDYSQIELRVLAHMCDEPALVDAFETGEDVHTATARAMFDLDGSQPSKEQRRLAKMLNYAVLYGVSGFGLAAQLGAGFSISDAGELIKLYNERFPTVKAFTKGIVTEARSKGFTTTLTGRRRYFPDIHAARVQDRQYAERQAMNAPIQGTAADMIKLAMVTVARLVEGTESRLLLNVHDELVLEVPEGDRSLVEPVRGAMESALPLSVPIEVDAKVGRDWNAMETIAR